MNVLFAKNEFSIARRSESYNAIHRLMQNGKKSQPNQKQQKRFQSNCDDE